jgi:hypothetical protein
MASHFSHKSVGSPASIVSRRCKQAGAWAVGPRGLNNAKGGIWWYGRWCWVLCDVMGGGVGFDGWPMGFMEI